MAPDQRRQAIVDVVVPLLLQHGRAVTTRQIAEAAGIAEGTIFRVFDTKEELLDAALASAFAPGPFLDQVAAIDRSLPLRERLVSYVTVLQNRLRGVFALMAAMGLVAPPEHLEEAHGRANWQAQLQKDLRAMVGPDADRLRMSAADLLQALWLLTFSGSHPGITDGKLMAPYEIVDLVLYGALRGDDPTRKS